MHAIIIVKSRSWQQYKLKGIYKDFNLIKRCLWNTGKNLWAWRVWLFLQSSYRANKVTSSPRSFASRHYTSRQIPTSVSFSIWVHENHILHSRSGIRHLPFSPTKGRDHVNTSIKLGNQYGWGEQLNCLMFITLFSYFNTAAGGKKSRAGRV